MLIHSCGSCGFESKIFEEWSEHLWGAVHQRVARSSFLKWSDDANLNSLVVYAPSKAPPPNPSEVVAIFHNLDIIVVDFVFWVDVARLFIVQLFNREDVERVLRLLRQQPEQLTIHGKSIQLRRKSDVLQNEWAILVGDGTAREGYSRDPVLIELSDDGGSPEPASGSQQNGHVEPEQDNGCANGEKRKNKRSEGESSNSNSTYSSNDGPVSESDCNASSSGSCEEPTEVQLITKMSTAFMQTFHSKIKHEVVPDDKRKVKENLVWMAEKWADIYLEFHDKFWPICLVMGNSDAKCSKISSVGYEARFKCDCLNSKNSSNSWLKEKFETVEERDAFVGSKVKEFYKLMINETECNRRLKELAQCKRRKSDKPLLNFSCHVLITFNNGPETKAELTISELQGKHLSKKLEIVQSIFKGVFKKYEEQKIKKWSAQVNPSERLVQCDEWTQILMQNE